MPAGDVKKMGALALLALFTALGARSALAGAEFWPMASTAQRLVITLQWGYVLLGVGTMVALLARHATVKPLLVAWAVLFTARTALAPVVSGGKGLVLGLAGGVIGLGIALAVLALALAPPQSPAPPEP